MHLPEPRAASLRAHLVARLEAISEADPAVLADYVIALLKHDKPLPDLKSHCVSELEDFLGEETLPFADELFEKLSSEEEAKPPSNNQPSTTAAAAATPAHGKRPRGAEQAQPVAVAAAVASPTNGSSPAVMPANTSTPGGTHQLNGELDAVSRPEKVARIDGPVPTPLADQSIRLQSPPAHQQQQQEQQRWGPGRQDGTTAAWQGPDRRQQIGRPRRCFDYFNKGYCVRGESCSFEHNAEVIVINNPSPRPTAPLGGMAAPYGMQSASVDSSIRPPPPGAGLVSRSGPVPMGFGSGRGRGRGRGGHFGSGATGPMGRPRAANGTALVVQNIPPEFCTMDQVHGFFKQFGSLTNINVDPHTQRAIIQYAQSSEAVAAHDSPEPIFGNRFVKVFWQREESETGGNIHRSGYNGSPNVNTHGVGAGDNRSFPGQNFVGGDMGARSNAHLMSPSARRTMAEGADMGDNPSAGAAAAAAAATAAANAAAAAAAATAAAVAKQAAHDEARRLQQEKARQLLEIKKTQEALINKQIEEQKRIMERLHTDKTLSAKGKKELLESLKALSERTRSIVASATSQKHLSKSQSQTALPASPLSETAAAVVFGKPTAETSTGAAVDPALSAQLEALKNEAKQLGIADSTSTSTGRVQPRVSGGAPAWTRGRHTLDNRPTRFVVSGVTSDNEAILRAHFEAFPGFTKFERDAEDASNAIVQYQVRWQSEQAMASRPKGPDAHVLPGIQFAWHVPASSPGVVHDGGGGGSVNSADAPGGDGDGGETVVEQTA